MKKLIYLLLLTGFYLLHSTCKKDAPVDPDNGGNNDGGQTTDTIYFTVEGITVSLRQPKFIRATAAYMEDDFKRISSLNPITQYGYCWSAIDSIPRVDNASFSMLGPRNSVGQFYDTIGPLQPNSTYYYTLYFESNGKRTYHPLVKKFTTPSPETPIILTLDTTSISPISNLTQTSATVFGRIEYAGTNGIKRYGHCWGLQENPVLFTPGTDTSLYIGNVTVATGFVSNLRNLALNTTYHIRAYAMSNSGEVLYGDDAMFTTNNITVVSPIVITQPATEITSTTVKLNGKISSTGGGNITESGFVYSNNPDPTVQTALVIELGAQAGAVPLEYAWYNLTPATSYFVRAYARNSEGFGYGDNIVVTTLSPNTNPPTVINLQTTNITTTNATVSAQATEEGGGSIVEYGFVWSKSTQEPSIANHDGIVTLTGTPGTAIFTQQLTTLEPSSSYWIRAFAKNNVNSSYSYGNPALQFQTITPNNSCPTLQNGAITNILTTTATANGKVTDPGGSDVTVYGHVWSKNTQQPTFTNNDGKTNFNGSPGTADFSSSLSGLSANTTYWVRSYAKNSVNSNYCYGDPAVQFSTYCNPAVSMGGISGVMQTSATASGNIDCIGATGIVTQHGHCWAPTPSPTVNNFKTQKGSNSAVGGFTSSMTGLTPGTTYYVRSYIVAGGNTYYNSGAGTTFTATPNTDPPTVVTTTTTGIQANQITANGQISALGCASVTEHGFCYSTLNSSPTVNDTKINLGAASQAYAFASNITCLDAATTYYIRAYAVNGCSTAYGSTQTVNTFTGFVVTCGLMAYYTFDGQNANDAWTNGWNGSANAGVSFSTDKPNSSGYSANFNGTNGKITVAKTIDLPTRSVSFWMKTTDATFKIYGVGYGYNLSFSSNKLVEENDVILATYSWSNASTLVDGNWHHIVLTRSAAGLHELYVDGIFRASGTPSSAYPLSGSSFDFSSSSSAEALAGKLDNFRFYNRVISSAEVQKLFQNKQ